MLSTTSLRLSLATAALSGYLLHASLGGVAYAHSWLDCIDHSELRALPGFRGNGVCEGYPYNFPGRGVGTDYSHKLLLADIELDSVPVCQYHVQDANYTGWRTAIEARAGDKLFFAYYSNERAVPGSKHGVYWDGRPGVELEKPSQLTKEHLVDGNLLESNDGSCGRSYTVDGDVKSCVGSFTIPKGTQIGTYPMVWWLKPDDLKNGYGGVRGATAYSSCFDVIVKESSAVQVETGVREGASHAAPPAVYTSPAGGAKTTARQLAKCGAAGEAKDPVSETPDKNSMPPVYRPTAASYQQASEQPPTPSTPTPSTPASTPQTPAPASSSSAPTSPAPAPTTTTPAPSTSTPAPAPTPVVLTPAPTSAPTPPSTTLAPTVTPSPAATPSSATPFVANNVFAAPLSTTTISGVGGNGSYDKVTNMQCPGTGASSGTCEKTPVSVSGPLAPFDEDLTLALRGPLEVDDIAVFTMSDASTWTKVSSYSKGNATQNMVFLNNKGDSAKSGEFSMCHGNSQSFASSNGATAASNASAFDGVLADGVEMNVMSETVCPASGGSCGFSRGVAREGWRGEHKIFMVKAQMPHSGATDLPAIWLLNGQVVRTAEYGCNCRGMGGNGGCGELDVAEVIPENKEMLTSTVYSFKGSRGTSPVVPRPTDSRVVFVVIFSSTATKMASNASIVQILMMRPESVDIENAPSSERVAEWLDYRNGPHVDFNI